MNHLTSLLLSLALTTVAGSAWAEPVAESAELGAETTEVPSGVVEGVSFDALPEMQAERDEMVAQWKADARAAGIDPESVEAGTAQN
jgi:hypothetical protein